MVCIFIQYREVHKTDPWMGLQNLPDGCVARCSLPRLSVRSRSLRSVRLALGPLATVIQTSPCARTGDTNNSPIAPEGWNQRGGAE
jgi:hypothetical protein